MSAQHWIELPRRAFTASAKIARELRQRGQKQVAEAMAFQSAAAGEPVLEQPRQQRFVLRQRHHAVADIARRQHVELAAQAAGAASRRRSP